MTGKAKNMQRIVKALLSLTIVAAAGLGCRDDAPGGFSNVERPPEPECERDLTPRTYEVFFVLDVSTSMGPFLNQLKTELVSLTLGFPEFDANGRRVRVDYYVVAFVNDVLWFPQGANRMTSHIDVQSAFEQAIAQGRTGNNLTTTAINAEEKENMLDALNSVIEYGPNAESRLVIIATDAPFAEAPDVLSTNNVVQSTYAQVMEDLAANELTVHAFTRPALDGLTRTYRDMPPLTSLPGATLHNLQDLDGSQEEVAKTLAEIAEDAACR